ncbi:hypothetical protein M514_07898 [Trichuris suis]|uniref:HTH CENPB-type domain-containing protein n=1 Tax=Trichuris suis TaxID=68888 RepID=A0A085N368_9BILA|nr:hypothetical protein M513_07898 [Trichuris suis]KFD63914.1 hypothetical protein M514_07898 [Trichuris suis]
MTAQQKELKQLTLNEKVDLIDFLEFSSQRMTAEHFRVSNIQKRKHEYLRRYDEGNRGRTAEKEENFSDHVNEATLSWFKQVRAVNVRIS